MHATKSAFLMFLSMLRHKYLERNQGIGATFHSVILAGVTNVKNLKFKMVTEDSYIPNESEGISASPWNIATNFDIDMSFAPPEIETMLHQYEVEHQTGMDLSEISQEIYNYTSGYPFLVSKICQSIDKEMNPNWSEEGVKNAVKSILKEKNTLFDDIFKNLENNKELYHFIYNVLIVGKLYTFDIENPIISFGEMFGIIACIVIPLHISQLYTDVSLTSYRS